jgi:hypothetical protein
MDHAEMSITETVTEMEPLPRDILIIDVSGSVLILESHSSASITRR